MLRSPKYPDPNADIGKHKFTYSILTHTGSVGVDTVREGYLLNSPIEFLEVGKTSGTNPDCFSLVKSTSPGFVIETVKAAEDGEGIIIRGYEALGDRECVTLEFGKEIKSASLCNLMEKVESELAVTNGKVNFVAKPFEIVSVKVK